MDLLVLMPVYDDWESAGLVLRKLDAVFAERPDVRASVTLLDDGSQQAPAAGDLDLEPRALASVRVLRLRRNLGHQRAIAVGLTWAHETTSCDAVLVMDADGEDRPEDVPRLIDALREQGGERVIFAARRRRTEGLVFRAGYLCYRLLHRVLVGFMTRVGNFSIVPRSQLGRLTVTNEVWGHYAASVFKARLPFATIEAARGKRLKGRSRMNFVGLVVHGLRAIAVYGERVAVRLLVAVSLLGLLAAGGGGVLVALAAARPELVPPWGPLVAAVALVLLFQLGTSAFMMAFSILTTRVGSAFLPLRDYAFFIGRVDDVTPSG